MAAKKQNTKAEEDFYKAAGQNLIEQSLVEEMEEAYLDYAMSVIVTRALPDVRDGMKPVQRRILYAMWDIGLKPSAKYRKSATVVGEVLGKYHPHGDASVYEAMVRMAQDFSLRYPLVNGQGNFGSMDGDGAAAMRYTESKLQKITEEMLLDIEKKTVDFVPNYDGSHKEPQVFPAKLPQLLLNGTVGIAVGMATNIPPHNLTELCNGIIHLIENDDVTVEDLMEHVKGPDFPTGGQIFNSNDIKEAYATGRGSIVMRGEANISEEKAGQFQIIINSIPYQVNKATLITKIADLVRDKKLDGIRDIRDESDREGVRVVIDLKKDSYPKKVLNRIFSLTQLQTTFHVNMVALQDGIQPKIFTLKEVLVEYIKHRQVVTRRRLEHELSVAEDRAHILEGLRIALQKLDVVINTIKKSKDKEEAKVNLIKKFKFSERQTVAILEMKLQQLANLERMRVEKELEEKLKIIKEIKEILASEKKILDVVKDDVLDIKERYGDERRTRIIKGGIGKFSQEDLIPKESAIITATHAGYIKRQSPETFKSQGRGGKGIIGLTTKEGDVVEQFFSTNTHADLLFFTTKGRVFQLKAYEVPVAGRTAKGQALVNFLQLGQDESVSAVMTMDELGSNKFIVMVTTKGVIKKVDIKNFAHVRRSGLNAIKLREDDRLKWVKPSAGKDEVILVTQNGQSIRFKESDLRPMGRIASGVRAIRLKGDDEVVGMDVIDKNNEKGQLLVVMEKGFGKKTYLKNYKIQKRGGSGIKTAKVTNKTGKIASAFVAVSVKKKDAEDDKSEKVGDLIIISVKGQVIRLSLKSVSSLGRDTQGVKLMRFKAAEDRVVNVTFI